MEKPRIQDDLYNYVNQEQLEKLVFKANNRGGNDNISIACLIKEENNDN